MAWSAPTAPLTASWTAPDQNQSYLLWERRDPAWMPPATPIGVSEDSVDLSDKLTGDEGWKITVQGVADNAVGPLLPTAPVSQPVFDFVYIEDGSGQGGSGSFEFTWQTGDAPPTYVLLTVLRGNTGVLSELVAGDAAQPAKYPSPVPVADGDTLTGSVRFVGNGAISQIASQTLVVSDLARPQLSWQIAASPTAEAIALVWPAVPDATEYKSRLFQG